MYFSLNDYLYDHDYHPFKKYNELIEKLSLNLQEFKKLKDSDELIKKLIGKINYSSDFYRLSFLIDQGSQSLKDYLIIKDHEKISLVEYVYKEYKEVLEKLASMNPEYIYKELGKIKFSLTVWGDNPTALDYALEYHILVGMLRLNNKRQKYSNHRLFFIRSKIECKQYLGQILQRLRH